MIRYKIPFKTFDNSDAEVQILIDGYNGEPEVLTGAANPVEWSEDDDSDLTSPIRAKTGYIRIIEAKHEQDLRPLTGGTHQVKVYEDGTLVFYGYIQAQAFANDYAPYPRVYEIPITSPLGLLDGYRFNPRTPSYVSIGTLLKEVASKFNVTGVVFPSEIWPESKASIGDYIESQLFCPYGDADVANPDKPLYDPQDYTSFIEAMCHAYGLVLHEEAMQWFFVKPNYSGNYIIIPLSHLDDLLYKETLDTSGADITNINQSFRFVSSNNIEESIYPTNELKYDYGSAVTSGSIDYRRTRKRGNMITNQTEVMQILEPLTEEIHSTKFITSASLDSSGALSSQGLYLCLYGTRESVNPGVLKYGDVAENVTFTFYERPFNRGFMLSFNTFAGDRISSLEQTDIAPHIVIQCGHFYYTGGYAENKGWRDNDATGDNYTSENGQYKIFISNPPAKNNAIRVTITLKHTKRYAAVGPLSLSFGEDVVSRWVGANPETSKVISGAPGSKDKKNIKLAFSYDSGDHRPVFNTDVYSYAIALAPDYGFLFQSQRRLTLEVRGSMPADAYVRLFSIQNEHYRLIAHGYNAADQIHTLTLQTVII